ncbi:MAG: bifunctional DNA-formamidopyrimidine glycosylase/DNA-(apurinic or apyrimidinic site) lyase [Desulfobulbaceae bacterium]|nr:bifunctional DNA-formamidopyrimidine glycosylase/DNA-(apurinic or apyrimidinic site) lyase [Desulfobulbaceae bacterium]
MPELPEVEVTRRGLLPHLPGHRITAVHWSNKRLRTPMPRKHLKAHIENHTVLTIDRRAKYLLIRADNGSVLVLHLGMTGKLGLFPAAAPRAKHDHLFLRLDNDIELRFNDSRRFGSIIVWPAEQSDQLEEAFTAGKGIEPFSASFTMENLLALARNKRQPVKAFLMNSKMIAGIGNIYANETLFDAGIAPETTVNQITEKEWQQIILSCRMILKKAIEAGGSTISDFLGSSGQPGYFQLQLLVYDRAGEACKGCGALIEKKALAGRATYFCPRCQF